MELKKMIGRILLAWWVGLIAGIDCKSVHRDQSVDGRKLRGGQLCFPDSQ
jgi:hypothetical protein